MHVERTRNDVKERSKQQYEIIIPHQKDQKQVLRVLYTIHYTIS